MGFPLRGRLTTVRPATEEDADLLVVWHADPEVAHYWDGETYTREQVVERLLRSTVEAYVVEEHSRPVGYLGAWREGDEGGIDMFLVAEARGRGLGPDAARALATHLRSERKWPTVTVDPYVWNDGAIRAWRRAGFREIETRPPDHDHTSEWLLMTFDC